MAEAAVKEHAAESEQELTDGFNLIIDALKLNELTTIYGVPQTEALAIAVVDRAISVLSIIVFGAASTLLWHCRHSGSVMRSGLAR